jgi:hypothetical protein
MARGPCYCIGHGDVPWPGIHRQTSLVCGILLFLLVPGLASVQAQSSGGPYGPIPQTYAIPDKAVHVYDVAPGLQRLLGGWAGDARTLGVSPFRTEIR